MDRVYSDIAYDIHGDMWIQAILNINGVAVVMGIHTQWPTELLELYKIYRRLDPARVHSIVLVMYNRHKLQSFRSEHLDEILLNWSIWTTRFQFSRNSSNTLKTNSHLMINTNYISHIQILYQPSIYINNMLHENGLLKSTVATCCRV
jgi:hypothetical protein